MKIEPLPKALYNKCIEDKISKFVLRFSGGSDEGYLDIDIESEYSDYNEDILHEIEDWAWDAYEYSGAGDGNSYGDNISYDVVNKSATHEEWYMEAKHSEGQVCNLELED